MIALVALHSATLPSAGYSLGITPGGSTKSKTLADEHTAGFSQGNITAGGELNLTTPVPSVAYSFKVMEKALQRLSQAIDDKDHVKPYGAWVRTALLSWLIWMVLAVSVFHLCYDLEVPLPDGDSKADPKETFETAHFHCCNEDTNWGICLCAFCCPALRWADTADLAGFLPLWPAFGLISTVGLLNCLSHGALAWGMYQTMLLLYSHAALSWGMWGIFSTCLMLYYRQHLRRKFGLVFGNWETCCADCCFIFWCPWCAIAQEALVVKQAYVVKMRQGRGHRRLCQLEHGVAWDEL